MMDTQRYPFTDEINAALLPHLTTLTALLEDPDSETVREADVPVKKWLRKQGALGIVPHSGDLSVMDVGGLANWFWTHVPGAKATQHIWLTRIQMGHARTLLIAARQRSSFETDAKYPVDGTMEKQHEFIMQKAWKHQCSAISDTFHCVDVDRQCIAALEGRMFEVSKKAGPAGHYQWGLDSGSHQGDWDPYMGGSWNNGDRDGSETELEVCTYIFFSTLILTNLRASAWPTFSE